LRVTRKRLGKKKTRTILFANRGGKKKRREEGEALPRLLGQTGKVGKKGRSCDRLGKKEKNEIAVDRQQKTKGRADRLARLTKGGNPRKP